MARRKITNAAKPRRILSIDSSTNSLAFGIFNGEELEKFGKINFHGTNVYQKAGDASKKTYGFVALYEIKAVVIESSVFMNSPKSALALATVQGAILGAAQMAGATDILSVTPIQWQNYIGNKRLETTEKIDIRKEYPGKTASWYKSFERKFRKQRTMNIINNKYGVNVIDDDVADSIGVGWFATENWVKLGGQP